MGGFLGGGGGGGGSSIGEAGSPVDNVRTWMNGGSLQNNMGFASSPGSNLARAAGVTSNYQAQNMYTPEQLQKMWGDQQHVYGQMQDLATQLQAQAAGTGPNPAQAQYEMNVQKDIANAQGLIASQRGVNPALAARMGANQASAQTGQAAGQSAVLQAQQQLGAQQQLSGLYGSMQQGNLYGQGLYGQQAQAANQLNSQQSLANQQAAMGIMGGLISGGGAAAGAASAMAHGGQVKGYDDGGEVGGGSESEATAEAPPPESAPASGIMSATANPPQDSGPQSQVGQILTQAPEKDLGLPQQNFAPPTMPTTGLGTLQGTSAASNSFQNMMKNWGKVAGSVGKMAAMAAHGGSIPKDFTGGGHVPGKAKVKGDSYKNDTVPAVVSPKEIVLPRSVTMSSDPVGNSAKFVAAILAKKGRK